VGRRIGKSGVRARTCFVAGVLDDSEKECRERGVQLRVGNAEHRAFKVEGKRHAWDMQDPELFAAGVKAWIEHQELPEGFIALEELLLASGFASVNDGIWHSHSLVSAFSRSSVFMDIEESLGVGLLKFLYRIDQFHVSLLISFANLELSLGCAKIQGSSPYI
jgi:hypothetical protein